MDAEDREHEGKTFEKISYQDKVVTERKFYKCIFKNCNLSSTHFKDCLFDDCVFEGCDLSLMKVKGSTFKKVKLKNCKAIGIQWFDTRTLFSIECHDTQISYSSFFAKDLKRTKFINCIAQEVDFTDCNLTEADFSGANLLDARFINCDLSFTNFNQACNYAFDVRENKLKKTKCSLPEALALLNYFDIELK